MMKEVIAWKKQMRKKEAERGRAKRRRDKCTTDYYFDFEEGRGEKGE